MSLLSLFANKALIFNILDASVTNKNGKFI